MGCMAGALSLKLLTCFSYFFSFFLPFFPSSCPGHTGNWEGADFIPRQLPGPRRKNPRYRAGSILQLRDDAFAALTRVGTRLFLPEQNMPLFPPKKACLWKSGGFSLHWVMLFSLLERLAIPLSCQENLWMPHPWKCPLDRCLRALPAGFSVLGDSLVLFHSFVQILFFKLHIRQPAAPDGKTKNQFCSWLSLFAGRL